MFVFSFLSHPENSSLDDLRSLFLLSLLLFFVTFLLLGIPRMLVEIILDMETQEAVVQMIP